MEGDMSDELLKLVEQLCPCEITVSGGEPMLHPDFLEISKRMRERFQGELVLSTNGTLITEEIAKEIVKYYDKFEISLDGACAQETDSIRGKGVFEKVMKAVSILKKYGKRIALSAVISRRQGKQILDRLELVAFEPRNGRILFKYPAVSCC